MSSAKQKAAARKNIKKAAKAAQVRTDNRPSQQENTHRTGKGRRKESQAHGTELIQCVPDESDV